MYEMSSMFKYIDILRYLFLLLGSSLSGFMLYNALTSEIERAQTRLKMKQNSDKAKMSKEEKIKKSYVEIKLKSAGYPLGLNGAKYNMLRMYVPLFLFFYYVLLPTVGGQAVSIYVILTIGLVYVAFIPQYGFIKFSPFNFVIGKLIEFQLAKKNTEIYMLHDMLINELQMMEMSRVNTYNILKGVRDYFDYIKMDLTILLSEYNTDPDKALTNFANSIDSKEAKALVSVLKTLDNNSRTTALESLRGMNKMFVALGVESYRRRRKLIIDLASIPMKGAIFLAVINILAVVVAMLSILMDSTNSL